MKVVFNESGEIPVDSRGMGRDGMGGRKARRQGTHTRRFSRRLLTGPPPVRNNQPHRRRDNLQFHRLYLISLFMPFTSTPQWPLSCTPGR